MNLTAGKSLPLIETRKRKRDHNGDDQPLPQDIIEEILLRLPAKIVLKFQSACKLFFQLSTASAFISSHTRRYRENPRLFPNSLALFQGNRIHNAINIMHGSKATTMEKIVLNNIPHRPLRTLRTLLNTSCDGLLCFTYEKTSMGSWHPCFIIFNPLTRKSYTVLLHDHKTNVEVICFYYHASSKKYRLLMRQGKYSHLEIPKYFVLTLGPNTMRTIENPTPNEPYSWAQSVLIQDNMYFIGKPKGTYYIQGNHLLFVFNVETEKFTYLPLPDTFMVVSYTFASNTLLDIQGSLCVCKVHFHLHCTHPKLRVELWVLKDSSKGIWIKKEVHLEIIQDQEESDYDVATYVHHPEGHHLFLLMKSSGDNDIASPEKKFTFYYLEDKLAKVKPFENSEVKSFNETLASINMQ